jgi:hypothetical protein
MDEIVENLAQLKLVEKLDSLPIEQLESLYLDQKQFEYIDEALLSLSKNSYIPRSQRNFVRDVLVLLEENTIETKDLVDNLSKKTAELHYINKKMRLKISEHLSKWKNILIQRGNEVLNAFVLKNGKVNPIFNNFCKSKGYIRKYTISKEFRKSNVAIEITGDKHAEEDFFHDLEEFDPGFKALTNLTITFVIGNCKYKDL